MCSLPVKSLIDRSERPCSFQPNRRWAEHTVAILFNEFFGFTTSDSAICMTWNSPIYLPEPKAGRFLPCPKLFGRPARDPFERAIELRH